MAPHCPLSSFLSLLLLLWPIFYLDQSRVMSLLQRTPADTQHRVVGEAEDLPRAALRLHCRGSEGPRGDWSRGVRLCQQDGPQADRPDHGCEGDPLVDAPETEKLFVSSGLFAWPPPKLQSFCKCKAHEQRWLSTNLYFTTLQ